MVRFEDAKYFVDEPLAHRLNIGEIHDNPFEFIEAEQNPARFRARNVSSRLRGEPHFNDGFIKFKIGIGILIKKLP